MTYRKSLFGGYNDKKMKDIYVFDNTCGRVGFRKNGMRIDKNQVLKDLNLMANHMRNEGCELEEITGEKIDIVPTSVNENHLTIGIDNMSGRIIHTENIEIDLSIILKCHCGSELTVAYENKIDKDSYEIVIEKCKSCWENENKEIE